MREELLFTITSVSVNTFSTISRLAALIDKWYFLPGDVESVHPELRDLHLQARVRVGDLKTEKVRLCDMRGLTTHLAL